ncbi:phosphopantetheine-binding protein [Streptomyces mesophilus]|uniref:phosphopantetheine-binding protein n=1 Tax=Streptomyces mesophilus TaxID=1775132 RepID=UPI00332469DB
MTGVPLTDGLAGVIQALAAVLRTEPDRIDPEQSFRTLGLDSIHTAELMAAINARFGTAVVADALYDHPTPAALARHVQAQGRSTQQTADHSTAQVREALRDRLAGIVGCDVERIDPEAPFHAFGLDSIRAAEFMAAINAAYGLAERPVTLYDHPDLATMAAHVTAVAYGTGTEPAPVRAEDAVTGPEMNQDEVGALLDAVRADMLTVDEAAALLAFRPA